MVSCSGSNSAPAAPPPGLAAAGPAQQLLQLEVRPLVNNQHKVTMKQKWHKNAVKQQVAVRKRRPLLQLEVTA